MDLKEKVTKVVSYTATPNDLGMESGTLCVISDDLDIKSEPVIKVIANKMRHSALLGEFKREEHYKIVCSIARELCTKGTVRVYAAEAMVVFTITKNVVLIDEDNPYYKICNAKTN